MNVKNDFPIFNRQINDHPLVYLDNAATTQKPRQVIEALVDYYQNHNANVHRGNHTLSDEATTMYEATRETVAKFINAKTCEIIFTRNTTEAINLVAFTWGRSNLKRGDTVVLTEIEHHSNLIPWYILAGEIGLNLEFIRLDNNFQIDLNHYSELLNNNKVKLVAFAHVSNVLGTIMPVKQMTKMARDLGAVVLIDAAQSVPRLKVDVMNLGADFVAFSSHKMLGPTGVGVLYGRKELLDAMPPFLSGGSMIDEVGRREVTFAPIPHKFEAGTPNIADVVAFKAAIEYLENFGIDKITALEEKLLSYAISSLAKIPEVTMYGPNDLKNRTGVLSFNIKGVHAHDASTIMDSLGVAVRSGHHCAAPLMKTLGVPATIRASFYLYNEPSDIDQLVVGIKKVIEVFRV